MSFASTAALADPTLTRDRPSAPESASERDRFLAEQPLPYAEAISLLQLVSQASDPYQKLRIICDACACVARCVEKYHAAAQPPPPTQTWQ